MTEATFTGTDGTYSVDTSNLTMVVDPKEGTTHTTSLKIEGNLVNNYLQKQDACATMIFVVGPEGGISPKEEELLENFGYTPITLGKLIMRVETAAIYIASITNFCSNS